jgi:hypothetical protein
MPGTSGADATIQPPPAVLVDGREAQRLARELNGNPEEACFRSWPRRKRSTATGGPSLIGRPRARQVFSNGRVSQARDISV